jgi:hypothetical protein
MFIWKLLLFGFHAWAAQFIVMDVDVTLKMNEASLTMKVKVRRDDKEG